MRSAALIVCAACALTSCRADAPPAEDITVWRRRGAWTGRGLTQTEPFISETGFLRLTWEARGTPAPDPPTRGCRARGPADVGTFRITVHSDVSGRPLLVAVDRRGPGRDVTYVTEDPRAFFLVIESEDLDWSVEVAEGLPATRPQPRR